MTWPVAKPGYWVDGNNPQEVRVCTETLGACPGAMAFGVGSPDWMEIGDIGNSISNGGVPEEACWIGPPFWGKADMPVTNQSGDDHILHFDCGSPDYPDAPCVDDSKNILRDDCFMTTKYIERGNAGNSLYNLQQDLTVKDTGSVDLIVRCRDKVGSRCCP